MKNKLITFIIFTLILSATLFAQPGGPGNDPQDNDNPPVGVPIDGGAGLLLLVGAAIGGYRYLRGKRKED